MKDNRSIKEYWNDYRNSVKNRPIWVIIGTLFTLGTILVSIFDIMELGSRFPWILENLSKVKSFLPLFLLCSSLLLLFMVTRYYREKAALRKAFDYIRISSRHLVVHLNKIEKDNLRELNLLTLDIQNSKNHLIHGMGPLAFDEYSSTYHLAEETRDMILRRNEAFKKRTITHSKSFLKDIFIDTTQLFHHSVSVNVKLTLKLLYNELIEETMLPDLKYWHAFVEDENERDRTGNLRNVTDDMLSLLNVDRPRYKLLYSGNDTKNKAVKKILVPLRAENIDHLYKQSKRLSSQKNFGFIECELVDYKHVNQDTVNNLIIPILLANSETISYYIEDCLQFISSFRDAGYMAFYDEFSDYPQDEKLESKTIDLSTFHKFYNGEGDDAEC